MTIQDVKELLNKGVKVYYVEFRYISASGSLTHITTSYFIDFLKEDIINEDR